MNIKTTTSLHATITEDSDFTPRLKQLKEKGHFLWHGGKYNSVIRTSKILPGLTLHETIHKMGYQSHKIRLCKNKIFISSENTSKECTIEFENEENAKAEYISIVGEEFKSKLNN